MPKARDSFTFDSITGTNPKTVINDFRSKEDRLIFPGSIFNPQGKYSSITDEDGFTLSNTIQFIIRKNPVKYMRNVPEILYNSNTGNLSFDADGKRSVFEPQHLATLAGAPSLGLKDLILT
jgi:hypothetical protein